MLNIEEVDCMRDYQIGCEHGSVEIVRASSIDEAKDLASDWIRSGDWETKQEVGVYVMPLLRLSDEEELERTWFTVEVGEDPQEPDCAKDAHDWRGVGGLSENPGVWSVGGTTMDYLAKCAHCGCQRHERRYGAQRNPGQMDEISYREAR